MNDEAEEVVAGLDALDEAMAEANKKRRRLAAFLKKTYSSPFPALLALRIATRQIEAGARSAGIDLDAIDDLIGYGDGGGVAPDAGGEWS
jgi:hypothetical protein